MCSLLDERHKRNQPQQPPQQQQQNESSLGDGTSTNDGNDDITLFESNLDDSNSGDNDNDVGFGSQHDDNNVGNAAATRKVSLSPTGSFGNCQQTDAGDESRNENETVADGGGIRDSSESNNDGGNNDSMMDASSATLHLSFANMSCGAGGVCNHTQHTGRGENGKFFITKA